MLKRSVPPFVAQMREMAALFEAEQPELDRMEGILADLLEQFYVKTATYSLDMWEEEFALAADPELSLEQRRARVLAKINSRPPATVRRLENLVRQTMGEEHVWIEEHPADYSFTVYVREDQLSDLLGTARQAVHDARPAHLNYRFVEQLIRESTSDLYTAGYGMLIYTSQGEVDVDGLYSALYCGGYGMFIKISGSEVTVP